MMKLVVQASRELDKKAVSLDVRTRKLEKRELAVISKEKEIKYKELRLKKLIRDRGLEDVNG